MTQYAIIRRILTLVQADQTLCIDTCKIGLAGGMHPASSINQTNPACSKIHYEPKMLLQTSAWTYTD